MRGDPYVESLERRIRALEGTRAPIEIIEARTIGPGGGAMAGGWDLRQRYAVQLPLPATLRARRVQATCRHPVGTSSIAVAIYRLNEARRFEQEAPLDARRELHLIKSFGLTGGTGDAFAAIAEVDAPLVLDPREGIFYVCFACHDVDAEIWSLDLGGNATWCSWRCGSAAGDPADGAALDDWPKRLTMGEAVTVVPCFAVRSAMGVRALGNVSHG